MCIVTRKIEAKVLNYHDLTCLDGAYFVTFCALSATSKMKAEFSYCDQINFNEPVRTPGSPEQQHIPNH